MSRRVRHLLLTTVGFAVCLALLAHWLTPATELVRFRNSLLAGVGTPADFRWVPTNPPPGFRQENSTTPTVIAYAAARIAAQSEPASAALDLVTHLRAKPKRKGPIKSSTVTAYRLITEQGRGYCADYTQAFNGLAYALDLPVREWGMSFDDFSGDGHAFSETWDADRNAWVFIDSFHGFFVRDRASGQAMSVLEFHARLAREDGFATLDVVPIGTAFRFDSAREAYDYYAKGADRFFLWFGNAVFSYDEHPVIRTLSGVSRSLEQLAAISLGIHPTLKILPTPTNAAAIAALQRFRIAVLALVLVTAVLSLVALLQLLGLLRNRRSRAAGSAGVHTETLTGPDTDVVES